MISVIAEASYTFDICVQIHSHQGLQLPQGKHQVILGIVNVRFGVLHVHLSPYHIVLGHPAALEFGLGLAITFLGVAVIFLVNIAEVRSQKTGIKSLFYLIYKILAALAGFLHCKVHALAGDVQASPQSHVHKRHGGAESSAHVVVCSHRNLLLPVSHLHHHCLFLDGSLVTSGESHVREKAGISSFLLITRLLDFLVGNHNRQRLAQGNVPSVLQRDCNGITSLSRRRKRSQ